MDLISFSEMTTIEIIGNIIGLIAMSLMVVTGFLKIKQHILMCQIIQLSVSAVGTFMLGGISGGISNIALGLAIVLCYNDILKVPAKIILSALILVIPIVFDGNSINIFFFLPIIANITYIWLMQLKNVIQLKLIIAITSTCWVIYALYIHMYTAAIITAISVIVTLISAGKLYYDKKKSA